MKIAGYDTDLTDAQWLLIEPLLPPPRRMGRPRTDRRRIRNALFYVAKAGCPWRLLPKECSAGQTLYHVWEALNARLRALVRDQAGQRSRPPVAILDRQSVKSDPPGGAVGDDAAKPIKGRKRHLLVDTSGRLLGVHVTSARPAAGSGSAPSAELRRLLRLVRDDETSPASPAAFGLLAMIHIQIRRLACALSIQGVSNRL